MTRNPFLTERNGKVVPNTHVLARKDRLFFRAQQAWLRWMEATGGVPRACKEADWYRMWANVEADERKGGER